MAVNMSRSENVDFQEGATDGKYYKTRPNTSPSPGYGDEIMRRNREHLNAAMNYGYLNREIPLAARALPGG